MNALILRTNLTPDLQAKLSDVGAILYHGMVRFGGGATLAGLMLGAIAVFIIDKDFRNATFFLQLEPRCCPSSG